MRLPGRLTLNPSDGGRLKVVGSFHDQDEVIAKTPADANGVVSVGLSTLLGLDAPPIQIFGDTAEGAVTLNQCLGAGGTYHVPWVLSGAHVAGSAPEFQAADFGIPQFAWWSGTSGLDSSLIVRDESRRVEEIRVIYRPVPEAVVDLPHGQLALRLPYVFRGDHVVESSVAQASTLEIRFADPSSITDVLQAHHALQALMSIAIAAPIGVSETRVETASEGWLHVHARGVGAGFYTDGRTTADRGDVLFTYAQLGELQGVGRWLTMVKKFWPAIASLTSRWYAPDLYDELQFFSMVTAAEAFERIRLDKQQVKLKPALMTLADLAGPPFRSVVGDVNGWATRVVRTRKEHVVHFGLCDAPDGESLYWLTSSLYVLVVLCLLRQCDVPVKNLPTPKNSHWMGTVANRLRRTQATTVAKREPI